MDSSTCLISKTIKSNSHARRQTLDTFLDTNTCNPNQASIIQDGSNSKSSRKFISFKRLFGYKSIKRVFKLGNKTPNLSVEKNIFSTSKIFRSGTKLVIKIGSKRVEKLDGKNETENETNELALKQSNVEKPEILKDSVVTKKQPLKTLSGDVPYVNQISYPLTIDIYLPSLSYICLGIKPEISYRNSLAITKPYLNPNPDDASYVTLISYPATVNIYLSPLSYISVGIKETEKKTNKFAIKQSIAKKPEILQVAVVTKEQPLKPFAGDISYVDQTSYPLIMNIYKSPLSYISVKEKVTENKPNKFALKQPNVMKPEMLKQSVVTKKQPLKTFSGGDSYVNQKS